MGGFPSESASLNFSPLSKKKLLADTYFGNLATQFQKRVLLVSGFPGRSELPD